MKLQQSTQFKINRCKYFASRYANIKNYILSAREWHYAYLLSKEMLREYDSIKHEIIGWEEERDDWRRVSLILYKIKKEAFKDFREQYF